MGISEKLQTESGLESEGKKWVITGISFRVPLRQINMKSLDKAPEEEEECSTTPTAEETKIPDPLPCPPAPRKQRPSSKCRFDGVREFFSPPDLDSVFIRRMERVK